MVIKTAPQQRLSDLQRVANVEERLLRYSKLKDLQALAYDKKMVVFDGYSANGRKLTVKVVQDVMWVHYEDRGDWICSGMLKR